MSPLHHAIATADLGALQAISLASQGGSPLAYPHKKPYGIGLAYGKVEIGAAYKLPEWGVKGQALRRLLHPKPQLFLLPPSWLSVTTTASTTACPRAALCSPVPPP